MKSPISGSNGFIGSHLMARLKQLGHSVIPIERQLLLDTYALRRLFIRENPDYIFHLAAYGNMSSQKDEQEIFKANVIGTWNMLTSSKDIKYKAFINMGSSSEYGKKDKPMSERDLPDADTFYGASKVAGTYLARSLAKQYDKPIMTVRPFSVYGPGEADFRFIPTICKSLIKDEEMSVALNPYHDWTYIDDVIDGIMHLIKRSVNASLYWYPVFNIGTNIEVSNASVISFLERISGKKLKIKMGYMNNTADHWTASNRKMQRLGFLPKVMLEKGLEKTYEYFQQRFKA